MNFSVNEFKIFFCFFLVLKFTYHLTFNISLVAANTNKNQQEFFSENQMIRPGEIKWLKFSSSHPGVVLKCRDEVIKLDKKGREYFGVVRESYFSDFKPFECSFLEDGKKVYKILFKILDKKFNEEKLRVSPRTIKLSEKDQKRANSEQLMLNRLYGLSENKIHFDSPFMTPLSSAVTSYYGTRRVYNKKKKGQHLGVDYRAPIGVKVPASNTGKVAFAGDLFYTGYTVIIDHGLDIFSVYGHLSKTLVKTGEIVKKGDIVGLSGNTGRTSGPHLHWGVKIQGQYVDGLVLVDESQKFFQK